MDKGTQMSSRRQFVRLVALAVAVRALVMLFSTGSNDVFIWAQVAEAVRDLGLMGAYDALFEANHPPLAALYMAGAHAVSEAAAVPFSWLVKVPALAGDALTAVLLWRVVADRRDVATARKVTVAYLFNPLTILLVAFHGNTDVLYVALVFAAVVALERDRALLAGVLFGASLNVKLIPVALAAALLVVLWRRGGFVRFAAGAAVALAPIWAVLVASPAVVAGRMIGYQHQRAEPWGLTGFEDLLSDAPLWYYANGRSLLAVGLIVAAAIAHRRRLDGYRSVGLAALTFLLLTPAFGVQYLAVAVPFLFVAVPRAARIYCLAAGAMLAVAYAGAIVSTVPLTTVFMDVLGPEVAAIGAVVWLACLWAAARLVATSGDGGEPLLVSDGLDRVPIA